MRGAIRELRRICQGDFAVWPAATPRICRDLALSALVTDAGRGAATSPCLTSDIIGRIIALSTNRRPEKAMAPRDEKIAALRAAHAVHPHPEAVVDALFAGGRPFFDARDLVQVKYEMLRRVHVEGHSVTHAAAAFGFSRPSFYAAQAAWRQAGLPGLLPARPGPRGAHKLTTEVVAFLEQALARDPALRSAQLTALVRDRFDLVVHPRSIERALGRRPKNLPGDGP